MSVLSEISSLTARSSIYAGTQLSKMRKDDYGLLMTSLCLAIESVFSFFGSDRDEHVIDSLAEIIVSEFWSFKFEEILMVLRNGKAGRYDKVYGKLSPQHVLEWIRTYDQNERAITCVQHNSRYKSKNVKSEVDKRFNDFLIELGKKMSLKASSSKNEEEDRASKFLAKYWMNKKLGKSLEELDGPDETETQKHP